MLGWLLLILSILQCESFIPAPRFADHFSKSTSIYSTKTLVSEKLSIQILMSDTGGGHRASANALRDAWETLYPDQIEVDIVDIFTDFGPFWPYNDYVEIYKIMAKYTFLWDAFFTFGATPFGMAVNEFLMELFCFDSFQTCLERSSSSGRRADMVVSVHPLCQDLPLKILASLDTNGRTRDLKARTTPFITVVTDLAGAHPTWFYPGVDKCFVPTDVLYQIAVNRSLKPHQLIQYGLPIRKGFWSGKATGSKSLLREKLDIDPDLPTVVIVGGGDGFGRIVDITSCLVDKLTTSSPSAENQIIVVCGKNQRAKEQLEKKSFPSSVNVFVKGFVYNMEEWMRASDILITKAGPGTIAEACICGLPSMLSSFLPGQEEGNVAFVIDSGFGDYSSNPNIISSKVSNWLADKDKLKQMKKSALETARPSATLDIAKDIAQVLFLSKKSDASSSSSQNLATS